MSGSPYWTGQFSCKPRNACVVALVRSSCLQVRTDTCLDFQSKSNPRQACVFTFVFLFSFLTDLASKVVQVAPSILCCNFPYLIAKPSLTGRQILEFQILEPSQRQHLGHTDFISIIIRPQYIYALIWDIVVVFIMIIKSSEFFASA